MKLAIDILGGDTAAEITLEAVIRAHKINPELKFILIGDEQVIKPAIQKAGFWDAVEIVHTLENIPVDEKPTEAIRSRVNSSIVLGLMALKQREDVGAFVSAGSTGALLTGAFMKIGRIPGVARPALCPFLPTVKPDVKVMLIDCGANMDCKPQHLAQFALMADVYYKALGLQNPRVGLLSVGTEDCKGNELTLETFAMLKKLDINFVGNMEAKGAFSGDYDICVCDGFVGNVLLKTAEGTLKLAMKNVKNVLTSGIRAKFAAMLVMSKLKRMGKKISEDAVGGSMFIGLKKPVIKAHGSATVDAFVNAILVADKTSKMNLANGIAEALEKAKDVITSQ